MTAPETAVLRPAGLVPYRAAYEWMHDLAARRLRGEVPDTLVLLEHPPVFTMGRRTRREDIVWTRDQIEAAGAELHEADRGGNVTFHGPGQLVGYPILDLGPRPDVARYVDRLEEAVMLACARAGVQGLGRNALNAGVWAGDRKVCAIGVRVIRMRVTLHGFALNCATDLRWYDAIVPCGLRNTGVTSLTELAGRPVTVAEVAPLVAGSLGRVFHRTMVPGAPAAQLDMDRALGGALSVPNP